MTVDPAQARLVRVAARALGRHHLVHAYGHCSLRLDDSHFLVAPSRPLGLIAPGEACTIVPLEGDLPDGVLGEVRIHREVYKIRPDVGGVVRSMSPRTMSLGTMRATARPRHGPGCYFAPGPALWDDPQLIRTDSQAEEMVSQLGQGCAIVMRGNGAVTVGASLEEAVVLTWYLEDASRVELDCRAAGSPLECGIIDAVAARARATWSGRIMERMWEYLTAGDPEASSSAARS